MRVLRQVALLWFRLLAATVVLLACGLAARLLAPRVPLDAPVVAQAVPAPGTDDISPFSQLTLRFSQAMNRASVEQALRLSPGHAGELRWDDDGRTLVFSPTQPLTAGASYQLRLDATAQSWLYRPLAAPFELAFRVAPAPTVTSLLPPDQAAGVARESALSLRFSRPMVPAELVDRELNLPELTITPPAQLSAAWLDQSTLLLRPQTPLLPGTPYTVTVGAELRDLSGSPLGEPLRWHFSTAAPEVLAVAPPAGARDVALRQPLVISLTQPLDPAALSAALAITPAVEGQLTTSLLPAANALSATQVVTFTPREGWLPTQAYSVSVPAGVAPALGQFALAAPARWSFTTAEQPRIIARFPGEAQTLPTGQDLRLVFSTAVDPQALAAALRFDPPVEEVSVRGSSSEIRLSAGWLPATSYTLTLPATLADTAGVALGREYRLRFVTAPAAPALRLAGVAGRFLTLPADQDHALALEYINLSSARLALYRLDEATLLRTLGFDDEEWRRFAPERYGLSEQAELALSLDGPQDLLAERAVPLSLREDQARLDPGAYYLRVASPAGPRIDLVVSVARAVLAIKASPEQVVVWATDVFSRTPLAELPLTLYQGDAVVARGRSDARGVWQVDYRAAPGAPPYVVIANGLLGAVSAEWRVGGGPAAQLARQRPSDYQGLLYTDRVQYRPDDEVRIGALVRQVDAAAPRWPVAGTRVELTARPLGGTVFYRDEVVLRAGRAEAAFRLPTDAQPGRYLIQADVGNARLETIFEVQEPLHSPLALALVLPARAAAGSTIPLSATVRSAEGLPLEGVEVRWRLGCLEQPEQPEQPCASLEGSGTSDALGVVGATATLPADWQGSFQLDARAVEVAGVEGEARALLEVLPPLRLLPSLASRLITEGASIELAVEMIGVDGVPRAGQLVDVELRRISLPDPAAPPTETLVLRRRLVSDDDGRATLALAGQAAGSYRVVLAEPGASAPQAELPLWISRAGFVDWPQLAGQLALVADRERYQAGDVVTLLPQLPFASAEALLVRERPGSIAVEARSLRAGEPLTLSLEAADAPGLVVSLLALPEAGAPALPLSGDIWLAVEPEPAPQVTITSDQTRYRPAQTATLTVSLSDAQGQPLSGEVTLLIGSNPGLAPDAVEALRQEPRAPGVATAHGLALTQRLAPRADRGAAPRPPRRDANLELASGASTAGATPTFWLTGLRADQRGQVVAQVPLPTAAGRLEVRALFSESASRLGLAAASVEVAEPLRVEPLLPPSLRVGDEVDLVVRVTNSDAVSHEVALSLAVGGVAPLGGSPLTQRFTLDSGASRIVRWGGSVGQASVAQIGFSADYGVVEPVRVEVQLPILPGVAQTVREGGGLAAPRFASGPLELGQARGSSSLDLVVAPSLQAALLFQWQQIDRLEPRDLLLDADATVAAAALAEAGLLGDQALAEPLRRLVAAQQRDGGWGWWPSSPSEPFITSRVALALGVAPDDSVPQTAIEAAQGFLRRALTEAESPQLRAFLLEGLAALDEPDLAAARQLGREADALDSDALVALLLALHRENAADPQLVAVLAARAQRAGDGVFWAASTRAPGDQAAVTARALRALRAVAPASPLIEPARRFLLDQYRYHGWGNSYASTRAIEALAQPVPAPARAYRYVVALNGMELLARNASTALTATEQIPLDAVDLEASNDLTVTRDEIEGELLVAYRLRTPRDAQPGGQFALQRSYLDPRTGAALDLSQLRLGALVEVRLTLVVPRAQEFLVVEDALPAAAALVLPSYGLSPFEAAYLAETQLRIYAGRLDPGVHEHRYLARLVAAGSFVAPAPRARLVYTPLAVGDGVTQRLVVRAP